MFTKRSTITHFNLEYHLKYYRLHDTISTHKITDCVLSPFLVQIVARFSMSSGRRRWLTWFRIGHGSADAYSLENFVLGSNSSLSEPCHLMLGLHNHGQKISPPSFWLLISP
uniref:SJCHGC07412 protein n=1 Tax=Schistosoma japonicum TaxID=6182 RepID=Q5DBD7_SCHJA|nr:SJCHGC07412 protein [Schistosoma japonicum]